MQIKAMTLMAMAYLLPGLPGQTNAIPGPNYERLVQQSTDCDGTIFGLNEKGRPEAALVKRRQKCDYCAALSMFLPAFWVASTVLATSRPAPRRVLAQPDTNTAVAISAIDANTLIFMMVVPRFGKVAKLNEINPSLFHGKCRQNGRTT